MRASLLGVPSMLFVISVPGFCPTSRHVVDGLHQRICGADSGPIDGFFIQSTESTSATLGSFPNPVVGNRAACPTESVTSRQSINP